MATAVDLLPKPYGMKTAFTVGIARGLAGQPWVVLNHRTGHAVLADDWPKMIEALNAMGRPLADDLK